MLLVLRFKMLVNSYFGPIFAIPGTEQCRKTEERLNKGFETFLKMFNSRHKIPLTQHKTIMQYGKVLLTQIGLNFGEDYEAPEDQG
jgi:hypothetical protein